MYNNLHIIRVLSKFLRNNKNIKNYLEYLGDDYENVIVMLDMYINFIGLRESFKSLYQKDKLSRREWYDLKMIGKKLNKLVNHIDKHNPRSSRNKESSSHYMVYCLFEDIMLMSEFQKYLGYKLPDNLFEDLFEFYLSGSMDYEFNSEEVNLMFAIKTYDMFNKVYESNDRDGLARLIKLNGRVKSYDIHNMMNYEFISSGKRVEDFNIISLIYKNNFLSHKFKVNEEQNILDNLLIHITSKESFLNSIPKDKQVEVLFKVFKDNYNNLIKGKSYEEIIDKFNNIAFNYDDKNIVKASNTKPKVLGLENKCKK